MGIRVLHITECYEAGVRHAIDTIVDVRSQDEHILLYAGNGVPSELFTLTQRFHATLLGRILQVRAVVRRHRPDVLHLHSSWAGVYARISSSSTPIVYQPHCFKFDDPTLSALKMRVFLAAEMILSTRTKVALTLTPHETALALRLNSGCHSVMVPNAPTLPVRTNSAERVDHSSRKFVMVGRISNQKDPQFFIDVAKIVASQNLDTQFVWVGDGDVAMKRRLIEAGVSVTGWLGRDELMTTLDTAFCYVHSARYEGFPLSVLDAAARDLPIVARSIPAFTGVNILQGESAEGVAEIIHTLLTEPSRFVNALEMSRGLLKIMNKSRQGTALAEAYAFALGEH